MQLSRTARGASIELYLTKTTLVAADEGVAVVPCTASTSLTADSHETTGCNLTPVRGMRINADTLFGHASTHATAHTYRLADRPI
jgi:hypothetical protein